MKSTSVSTIGLSLQSCIQPQQPKDQQQQFFEKSSSPSFSFLMSEYPFDLGLEETNELSLFNFSGTNIVKKDWLKRGLLWYYAFNHEESIYCFKMALDIDPKCAMAHYGISMCHGPNYNAAEMSRDEFPSASSAFSHCVIANDLIRDQSSDCSEIEKSLICALSTRFNPVTDDDASLRQNTLEFVRSMEQVYEAYPDHPCIASLYAEAMMNTNPWKLWNLDTGVPTSYAEKAQIVLQKGLLLFPRHPGLNHFYIHLMEMSPTPSLALPSCDTLRYHCAPDAGHLLHMASHIYVLLGRYEDAVASNVEGVRADDKYVTKAGVMNFYTGYRVHNMHFIAYAAMFAGMYVCMYVCMYFVQGV
jgi:tetratricopeptide (TPR) repeat protein